MADFLSDRVGLRALSRNVEATFGQNIESTATFIAFGYKDSPIEREMLNMYSDKDKVTGSHLPTSTAILTQHLTHQHQDDLTCNALGMALGCMAEAETSALASGESAIWTKNYKFLSSGLTASFGQLTMKTRNLIEMLGDESKRYSGIAVNGFEIKSSRGNPCEITLDLNGYSATGATVKTRANVDSFYTAHPFLRFGDVTFAEGTYTASSEAFSSPTNHHARTIDMMVGCRKTLDKQQQLGDTGDTITNIFATSVEAFCTFKYEPDTISDWFDKYEAQTEFAVRVLVTGPVIAGAANSTEYKIQLIFAKCRVKGTPKLSREDGKLVRSVELEIMGNPTGADNESEFMMIDLTDNVQFYAAT